MRDISEAATAGDLRTVGKAFRHPVNGGGGTVVRELLCLYGFENVPAMVLLAGAVLRRAGTVAAVEFVARCWLDRERHGGTT